MLPDPAVVLFDAVNLPRLFIHCRAGVPCTPLPEPERNPVAVFLSGCTNLTFARMGLMDFGLVKEALAAPLGGEPFTDSVGTFDRGPVFGSASTASDAAAAGGIAKFRRSGGQSWAKPISASGEPFRSIAQGS